MIEMRLSVADVSERRPYLQAMPAARSLQPRSYPIWWPLGFVQEIARRHLIVG